MPEAVLQLEESNRIIAWRADRAAVADQQRQERLTAANQDREKRLIQFEIDKEARLEVMRQKRDAEIAAIESQRLVIAGSKLASLTDLHDIETEIRKSRRLSIRLAMMRILVFVGLPIAATAAYLAWFATPIYTATTIFSVKDLSVAHGNDPAANATLLQKVRTFISSPELMQELETEMHFVQQFSGNDVDPLRRARAIPALGRDQLSLFRKFAFSRIDTQSGLLTLVVKGRESVDAITASEIIVSHVATMARPNAKDFAAQQSQMSVIAEQPIEIEIMSGPYSDPNSGKSGYLKLFMISSLFFIFIYAIFTTLLASCSYYANR